MQKIFTLLLFATLIAFTANGQINPCSINTDEEIDICNLDNQLTLTAFAGDDIDLSTIEWSTVHTNIFTITNPTDLVTVIDVIPNPPVGCYDFTLIGFCDGNNQQLQKTVTVCIQPDATPAEITVNGQSVDQFTGCNTLTLLGNDNLTTDEFGLWINAEAYPDLTITGLNSINSDLTVSINNRRIDPCEEYTFYYQVSNGGCFSRDTITIILEGQDQTPNIYQPADGESYCATQVRLQGSNVSCVSDISNFSYTLQSPSQYNLPPTPGNETLTEVFTFQTWTFYESGWYTFVYIVDDTAVCSGGSDTVTFYVCIEGADQPLHENITRLYCDEIPSQLSFTDPLFPDYTYSNFAVNSSMGTATATQVGDDVVITNPNSENLFITVSQDYIVSECEGNPCVATRTIRLLRGPDIELEADTFTYLCGSLLQWNPWSQVTVTGFGFRRLEVLASPAGSNVDVGTVITGGTAALNLVTTGLYQFEMRMFRTVNGVTCEDTAILTVLICDPGDPSAPTIADFCAGDTVQIVGTIPMDTCAIPFWSQISGPAITFVNGTGPGDINPYITVADPGPVSLEYSYSREEYCYLADTSVFNVNPCEDDCIIATVTNIYCDNQGTDETDDDFWYFDIVVTTTDPDPTYWTTTGDILENGSYNDTKTIYPGGTISNNGSVTFTIFDADNPQCSTEVTVVAPEPCSIDCELEVKYEVSECDDNGTSDYASDDFYTVTLAISGTNGEPWMIKQKFSDGSENLLLQGVGDTSVTLTLNTQDGDFTMWVFLSEYFDCIQDFYIDAPDPCSGCLSVIVSNVQCYDNGSSDPSDDYWTFDILVEGGDNYWSTNGDLNENGSYGEVKTIWVGDIQGDLSFTVYDVGSEKCYTDITVSSPETCSVECKLEVGLESYCKEIEGTNVYFVEMDIDVEGDECFMVKRKDSDGTESILGTYNGSQTVVLGPFATGEEFTLWVMQCEVFDCVRDFYISAPEKCENCLEYNVSNVTCYDNGTTDSSDDYWTFDIYVTGPNDYWNMTGDINESGSYGQTKTIWVGSITDIPAVLFTLADNKEEKCYAEVKVQAPESCSTRCELEARIKVSDCKEDRQGAVFFVTVSVDVADDECFMIKKKNDNGTEEVLGTYYGSANISLGPFAAGEDFGLWILLCDITDCVRDFYVNAPTCGKEDGKTTTRSIKSFSDLSLSPNPSVDIVNVNTTFTDGAYQLISFEGKQLLKGNLAGTTTTIDVTNIRSGVYFIRVVDLENNVQIAKISILK